VFLFPWQIAGFAIVVVSGLLLVLSEPLRFYGNSSFRIKLVLLTLTALNAASFHATIFRRVVGWQPVRPLGRAWQERPPWSCGPGSSSARG